MSLKFFDVTHSLKSLSSGCGFIAETLNLLIHSFLRKLGKKTSRQVWNFIPVGYKTIRDILGKGIAQSSRKVLDLFSLYQPLSSPSFLFNLRKYLNERRLLNDRCSRIFFLNFNNSPSQWQKFKINNDETFRLLLVIKTEAVS